MADQDSRRLRSAGELSDKELIERYRRLFQTAQETPPDTPAWYDLEVPASLIADELRRRAAQTPELNPETLWGDWQEKRGVPQLSIGEEPFTPEVLDRTVIAVPLLKDIEREPDEPHDIIIDLNLDFPGGRQAARNRVKEVAENLPAITFNEETPQYTVRNAHRTADPGAGAQGSIACRRHGGTCDLPHLAGLSDPAADLQVGEHGQGGRGAPGLSPRSVTASSGR